MPLIVALLLMQRSVPPPAPRIATAKIAEVRGLIAEMRAAKRIEVDHVDGDTVLARKIFKGGAKTENAGITLLKAAEADFMKRPNDFVLQCGFHADVAIVAKGKRTLKAEMCFGCGEVRVTVPGPPMRRFVIWVMTDRDAMKAEVHRLYPGIRLELRYSGPTPETGG